MECGFDLSRVSSWYQHKHTPNSAQGGSLKELEGPACTWNVLEIQQQTKQQNGDRECHETCLGDLFFCHFGRVEDQMQSFEGDFFLLDHIGSISIAKVDARDTLE